MTWETAWKKKKLLKREIFTIITMLAAMMSRKTMILNTLIAFKITNPGPAKDSFNEAIVIRVCVSQVKAQFCTTRRHYQRIMQEC